MRLNNLRSAAGSRKYSRRVGRGASSGWGKTCGRGSKGQKSRSGGGVSRGFEGGQMPLQMRLPKFGFHSRLAATTTAVRTSELGRLAGDVVTLGTLKAAGLVRRDMRRARIFHSGDPGKAFTVRNVRLTAGAKRAIERAGGKTS